MKPWIRWKDWLNGLVGVWFLVSPWILGLSENTSILWTGVTLGVLIALASVWALITPEGQVPELCNMVLGLIAFIAPWVFSFAVETAGAWNAWIVGAVALILGAWALMDVRQAAEFERTPGRHTKVG